MKIYYRPYAAFLLLLFMIITPFKTYSQIAGLLSTNSLKQVDGIRIPFQNGFAVPSFEKQSREILNLKGEWKKQRFAANDNVTLAKRDSAGYQNMLNEAQNRHLQSYDDSGWELKTLPSVENQMNPYPQVPEYYQDGVWYRKSFTVDASNAESFAKLMFYSVNYVADVWLNDVYLGWHEGGYTPFAFDVSEVLNYTSNNVLVVRVDNPQWGTRNDIVPYTQADWFNYTGIIHDVYLEFSDPVSVIRANIVPQNTDGDVQTTLVLFNKGNADKNINVNIEVYNAELNETNFNSEKASDITGLSAAITGTSSTSFLIKSDSTKVWRTDLRVLNPKLWTPKTPDLYVMRVTITEGTTVLDEYFTQFGIRTVKTSVDKVLLNDKPVFFTGIARHEDHPLFGRSIPIDSIYSDMLKVKSLKVNMLRTAHYPNHLHTYLLADRLGIAVVEEIPVWWFDESFAWVLQNSVRHIHEQMFREMVFKDYNRPSILLWSTANECLDVTNRQQFIQKVNQELDFNYADGRLVTQSAAADRPGPEDPSMAACDVAGWTMYFGIFHGGTYYDGTRRFLGYANLEYPEKPILDTEYGYWSGELNSPTGQANQVTVFTETFNAFTYRASVIRPDGSYRDGGYLMGVTWWCIFDWYSAQHPQGFQSMGIYRMNRDTIKAVGQTMINAYTPFYDLGGMVTDIDNETGFVPEEFLLEQNYPNPFNPKTKIRWQSPAGIWQTLKVYDILGNEVTTLVNEFREAGKYEIEFDASDLASGVYLFRLKAGEFESSRKMILIK
ncbi:MAG: T9SS type A sorting domain-containing protein [Ignavibacteriales bacterium]|nr:MAG: T9SS type A sorting domain-containing protein [Ignavibacteriales bacterium]